MPNFIKTSRLSLTPFERTDIDRFIELVNDEGVARSLASLPLPFTAPDAQAWIADREQQQASNNKYLFAIKTKTSGFIGVIGMDRQNKELFDLGYWLGRKFWGQGYASEAASAILHWAETNVGIKAITASYFQDNPASGRVLEKSGFLHTGVKTMRYSPAHDKRINNIGMIWLGNTPVSHGREIL